MKLAKVSKNMGYQLLEHGPTLLSCAGTVGVVATSILTAKGAIKATENHTLKGEHKKSVDEIRTALPYFAPAIGMGIVTIGCIFGANVLNKRNQKALIGAYAMLGQSYQNYRKAAKDVYGEDADRKILAQVAEEKYISCQASGCSIYEPDLDAGADDELFFEHYSGQYFTAKLSAVLNAQYHINRNLALRGYVTVNEFYEFLGIDKIEIGETIGWDLSALMENEMAWLDFENQHTKLSGGMECYIVSTLYPPMRLDDEDLVW